MEAKLFYKIAAIAFKDSVFTYQPKFPYSGNCLPQIENELREKLNEDHFKLVNNPINTVENLEKLKGLVKLVMGISEEARKYLLMKIIKSELNLNMMKYQKTLAKNSIISKDLVSLKELISTVSSISEEAQVYLYLAWIRMCHYSLKDRTEYYDPEKVHTFLKNAGSSGAVLLNIVTSKTHSTGELVDMIHLLKSFLSLSKDRQQIYLDWIKNPAIEISHEHFVLKDSFFSLFSEVKHHDIAAFLEQVLLMSNYYSFQEGRLFGHEINSEVLDQFQVISRLDDCLKQHKKMVLATKAKNSPSLQQQIMNAKVL